MKGFHAMDSDRDGEVEMTALARALRAVGYGRNLPSRRGPGPGVDPDERFASLDADGNGVLSGEEPGSYMRRTQHFEDREITLEEYRVAWAELASRRGGRGGRSRGGGRGEVDAGHVEFLAGLDRSADRKLTAAESTDAIRTEISEAMEERTSLDVNGDGFVAPQEYALSQPAGRNPSGGSGLDGHALDHFRREDLDGDGAISIAEVARRVGATKLRMFTAIQLSLRLAQAETNNDGRLDRAELNALGGNGLADLLGVESDAPVEMARLYGKLYGASEDQALAIGRLLPDN